MCNISTHNSGFFLRTVSQRPHWAAVLNGLHALNIKCAAWPLSVSGAGANFLNISSNGLICSATGCCGFRELFERQFLQIASFRVCRCFLMCVANGWFAQSSVLAAPFFVRVLNISLCASVDIMSSSSSCLPSSCRFTICRDLIHDLPGRWIISEQNH